MESDWVLTPGCLERSEASIFREQPQAVALTFDQNVAILSYGTVFRLFEKGKGYSPLKYLFGPRCYSKRG